MSVGTNDLKIAAIVQRHGATLATCNLRDFKRIPGMRLEDWL
jgi:predicted nucleic acid-binding protein